MSVRSSALRRLPILIGSGLSVLGVLVLCRGLIFGSGGYLLFIDASLPSSNILLRGTCNQSLGLWSTTNLGIRVLYPNEYLACGAITGGLEAGVPAWLISRLLPIAALCVAGLGMFNLLLALRNALPLSSEGAGINTIDAMAATATSVLYACSPYSFTEMVAGHWLYLIAMAAFPWSALILFTWKRGAPAVVGAGVFLAFTYVQVQFMVLGPAMLLLIAFLIRSRRMGVRAVLASIVGVVPHLPWIIPLFVYPAAVNISSYFPPGTVAKFSIHPIDGLRLVGYVTPFVEVTVKSWGGLWSVLSFGVLFVSLLGVLRFALKQAVALMTVLFLVLIYQWGIYSPGYDVWSRAIPIPAQVLFRERYVLSFITLVALSITFFVGLRSLGELGQPTRTIPGRRIRSLSQAFASAIALLSLVGTAGPFLDGHLGSFGAVREDFSTATLLTEFIDSHGGGSVLTIPFGSIVKAPSWPLLGRSPFSLGGPPNVLDVESAPNAPALPLVQALANSLNGPIYTDPDVAAEYMQLLGVAYVVEWSALEGDTSVDVAAVTQHLRQMGAQVVWSNQDATLWRTSGTSPSPSLVTSTDLMVTAELRWDVYHEAQLWGLPLAVAQSGKAEQVFHTALLSGGLIQLVKRSISISRRGSMMSVTEPVFIPQTQGLTHAELTHELVVAGTGIWAFGDGTVIPEGVSSAVVLGPVDKVYASRVDASVSSASLLNAAGNITDTRNDQGLSLAAAGISAQVISSQAGQLSVSVSALHDEAALPIPLPVVNGASYSLSFVSDAVTGSAGRVAIVGNPGARTIFQESLPLDQSPKTVTVHFKAPTDTTGLYMFLYVEGSNGSRPAQFTYSQLSGTVTEALSLDPASSQARIDLSQGPNVAQLPDQTASSFPDLVIRARPASCESSTSCLQESGAGLWLIDRQGADPWWQLESAQALRSDLLADGLGPIWFVPQGRSIVQPRLVYLPNSLFIALLAYEAILLGLGLLGYSLPLAGRAKRAILGAPRFRPAKRNSRLR